MSPIVGNKNWQTPGDYLIQSPKFSLKFGKTLRLKILPANFFGKKKSQKFSLVPPRNLCPVNLPKK